METFDINVSAAVSDETVANLNAEGAAALETVLKGTGAGNDFLGWVNLPSSTINSDLVEEIMAVANVLRAECEAVVCIGIGGSYLGAKAVIEALKGTFEATKPEILFAGQNIGEDYLADLQDYLADKRFGIVVISKSGTTTEPAIAFRLLKAQLEAKVGKEEASRLIVAVTDASKGALRKLATDEGYATFVIDDNVGGRFSVLSPVGLLPIAIAGFNIRALLQGAADMEQICAKPGNPAQLYAETRNALYRDGKKTEILVNYNPKLHFFGEWWKQLYGESEGKDHKGIFPAAVDNSTDLHSMGQWIQ
ncbi:MAG: glucose-6-phosphate isomerase, partial [Muribaculaceae bacterium]|nr:glucose-6-phosphate isomerase [Muribaculaceae bacterium]